MSDGTGYFLGHTVGYWLELQRRNREYGPLRSSDLLEEIVLLRGKVDFYEDRIKEMASTIR